MKASRVQGVLIAIVLVALVGCFVVLVVTRLVRWFSREGPVTQETRYYAPVWSPDGNQVAYVKRALVYQFIGPPPILAGETTRPVRVMEDRFFLAVNDPRGTNERIVSELFVNAPQQDPERINDAYAEVEWSTPDTILYSLLVSGRFDTGVHAVVLTERQDVLQPDRIYLQTGPVEQNGQELYAGNGKYGLFSLNTIYLFNHTMRTVEVYLHDPFSQESLIVPMYDVTQHPRGLP